MQSALHESDGERNINFLFHVPNQDKKEEEEQKSNARSSFA